MSAVRHETVLRFKENDWIVFSFKIVQDAATRVRTMHCNELQVLACLLLIVIIPDDNVRSIGRTADLHAESFLFRILGEACY